MNAGTYNITGKRTGGLERWDTGVRKLRNRKKEWDDTELEDGIAWE